VKAWGRSVLICGALVGLVPGCENSGLSRDFERMVNQPHLKVYRESEFFPDRRAMREPPLGTVPADGLQLPVAVERGVVDGSYVQKNPVLLTSNFVQFGRRRFDVFCAPCHGELGNGVSVVARKMTLRPPPSLVGDRVRQFPDGRIFEVITQGYGVMPNYSRDIGVIERWAIVAYVRALSLQEAGIPLDRLPQPLRSQVEEALQ